MAKVSLQKHAASSGMKELKERFGTSQQTLAPKRAVCEDSRTACVALRASSTACSGELLCVDGAATTSSLSSAPASSHRTDDLDHSSGPETCQRVLADQNTSPRPHSCSDINATLRRIVRGTLSHVRTCCLLCHWGQHAVIEVAPIVAVGIPALLVGHLPSRLTRLVRAAHTAHISCRAHTTCTCAASRKPQTNHHFHMYHSVTVRMQMLALQHSNHQLISQE